MKSNLEISDFHKLSELQVYISATKPVFKLRELHATAEQIYGIKNYGYFQIISACHLGWYR